MGVSKPLKVSLHPWAKKSAPANANASGGKETRGDPSLRWINSLFNESTAYLLIFNMYIKQYCWI